MTISDIVPGTAGSVTDHESAKLSIAAGVGDIFARLMGQWLSERLGRPFIIENRPGAGSALAAEAVVRAAPDGLHAALGKYGESDQHDAVRQSKL